MGKQSKTRCLYFSGRITKAMSDIFQYPLTIVEAPMGYGKTTAVSEHLNQSHANVLAQKVYNSSVSSFWDGFCSLLGKMDPNRAYSLLQLEFPNDRVSMQEALKLIKEIRLPEKTVLFIDDFHLLNETEAGSFLEFLVFNEISNLHIVLTARFIELQSMEELALKNRLLHIKKDVFELLPDEIKSYFNLCGVSITKTEAEKLYLTTEGWISALYLLMLNYKAEGRFMITDNINKLIENAIYKPFSDEVKEFLLKMSIFNSFTKKQAVYIWGNADAELFLDEISKKNALVTYDVGTKTYHIHNIYTNFLQDVLEEKGAAFKSKLYQKAGDWQAKDGQYPEAMFSYYKAGDFDSLLSVVELDRGNCLGIEQKDLVIQIFKECPQEFKERHLAALLIYAMALITFNEMGLFQKVCAEVAVLIQNSSLDQDSIHSLEGELELLLSFTKYNDIRGMSQHHKKACELMKRPSVFMTTKGSWSFGSPSVLYMFYRESGKLEEEVDDLIEAMPYYYQLTDGHGMGAEYVMEAERYFNRGDFENAEISIHKAHYQASIGAQPNIVICALFLQVRLALEKGDYEGSLQLLEKMHEEIEHKNMYLLIHSIDMCKGFINAYLQQGDIIPESAGDYNSQRICFQTLAFYNIIYGRVLLIKGQYLKLLGTADYFYSVASVFPSILAKIYTAVYIAAANERIYRRREAVEALKQALDMATPDKVYIPFVENCDYIKPVLEELLSLNVYSKDIERILKLSKTHQKALDLIRDRYFTEDKPRLTQREAEIGQLAAGGYSNKEISERLFVSENTVKTQLKSVFEKTGVHSRILLKPYFEDIIEYR